MNCLLAMRPFRHVPLPLLLCLVLTAPAFAQTCPAERRVRFDPVTWTKQLRAAKTTQTVQSLLKAAGLEPIDEFCSEPHDPAPGPWFSAVNAFLAPIDPEGRPVRAVNVLGGLCGQAPDDSNPASPEFQRGAVYVAIKKGEWCRIDAPFLNAQGSGYGPTLCVPAVFGFESLVSADRKALWVSEQQEWCGGAGSARGASRWVGYYEVRGWKLHPLWRLQTYEGLYNSATGASSETTRLVQLTGDWPRVLQVRTTTSCSQLDEDRVLAGTRVEDCMPSQSRSVWRYREGTYQEEKLKP